MHDTVTGPPWPDGALVVDADRLGPLRPQHVAALEARPWPTVVTVTAACTGAALAVASVADIVAAGHHAVFGRPGPWTDVVLRRAVGLIGRKATAYLALSGRLLDAETALRWGFVSAVVDEPAAHAGAVIDLLAARSPVAVATVLAQAHRGAAADHARSSITSWPWSVHTDDTASP